MILGRARSFAMTISIGLHLLRSPSQIFLATAVIWANQFSVFLVHVCGEFVQSSPPGAAVKFLKPGYISRLEVHGDSLTAVPRRSNLVTVGLSVAALPDYEVMFVAPVVIHAYAEESSLNISVRVRKVSTILASSTCWNNLHWAACCFYSGPDLNGVNPSCFDPPLRPDACCVWKSPVEATVEVYKCSLSPWQDSWVKLQKTIVDCSGRTSKVARECVQLVDHRLLSNEAGGCWIGQAILSLFLGLHDLGHSMQPSTPKLRLYQQMSEARNHTHSLKLNMHYLRQMCLSWGFEMPQLSSCLAEFRCSSVSPVDPIALAVCTMCLVVCADPVGVHAAGWKEPMDKLVSILYDMAIAAQRAIFKKGLHSDLSQEVVWVAKHMSESSQMAKAFLEWFLSATAHMHPATAFAVYAKALLQPFQERPSTKRHHGTYRAEVRWN
eukprot:4836957-Amphidinium_carterae.1